jgi:hypothetical protein
MVIATKERTLDMSRTGSKLLIAEIMQMIAGLQKYFAGQTLVLAGESVKVDDLIKEFTAFAAQLNSANAAHLAWLAQVKALDETTDTEINPRFVTLHRFLEGRFGMASASLGDFGMKPRKARARTAAQKAATAQKSAATRTARHTLGPRQKAAIHGTAAAPAPAPTEPEAPKK